MEISGKIIAVLPLQSGTSKAGRAWKKQEYVLETQDTYPRKVKFDFFGDRVDQYPMAIGERRRVFPVSPERALWLLPPALERPP